MAPKFENNSRKFWKKDTEGDLEEESLLQDGADTGLDADTTLSETTDASEPWGPSGMMAARGRIKKMLRDAEADSEETATDPVAEQDELAPQPEETEDVAEEEDPVLVAPPPDTETEEPTSDFVADDTTTEPVAEETTEELVEEDTTTESDAGDATPEPVAEETREEPADEETTTAIDAGDTTTEPVAEETTDEAVEEDTETGTGAGDTITDTEAGDTTSETDAENTTEDAGGDDTASQTEGEAALGEPVSVSRQVAPTALDGSGALTVAGGRVTTLSLPEAAADIAGVKITSLPTHGNVTVNPDYTLALVLSGSDYSGPLSFDYSVTHSDGSITSHTVELSVSQPTLEAGWGLGNHYMLATDANDDLVIEHGDNHRKLYISNGENGLTKADIAAMEGLSEGDITNDWLIANPEYGGSEDLPLQEDTVDPWPETSILGGSSWVLLERGHEYSKHWWGIGTKGESELHPRLITSWGSGERPVITTQNKIIKEPAEKIVVQNIQLEGGLSVLTSSNVILDGVKLTKEGLGVQGFDFTTVGWTIRNSEIVNVIKEAPVDPDNGWEGNANREAGSYIKNVEGLLLEGNIYLHNGWGEGYTGSPDNPMPPSMYSHNLYLQSDTRDVTARDNIFAQAASVGAQFRGGAFAENNLYLDNQAAFNVGDGNFSLLLDNIVTSAGFKDAEQIGAKDWGIRNESYDTSLLGNIVAHKADPNNPEEIAFKTLTKSNPAFNQYAPFFNDTIVYNWNGFEANIEGLDPAALDQVTIQNFALEFLGLDPADATANEDMGLYYKSGLIYDLMEYARANWQDGSLSSRDIIDWFQAGFGFEPRAEGETHHRFIPNDLGDGVRWDNRLNWSSDARPDDGDTVDLGGNWVNYAGTTALSALSLGPGGKLQVGQGKLTVEALEVGESGGMLFVERAGQFWTNGFAGEAMLSVDVSGGRFANTGEITGSFTMNVDGGQAILGVDNASFGIGNDSELRISGSSAKVGFDGAENGIATLMLEDGGSLSFLSDGNGFATLKEFRSGAWDQDGSNVHSGITLNGTLTLDLGGFAGNGRLELIEVDAIAGHFDAVSIHGLGGNRDAELVIDYAADLVMLELSNGSGQASISTIGDALDGSDEDAALWDELAAGLSPDPSSETTVVVFDDPIDPLNEMSFL
ncbi:hypothetical protein [Rhodosalinus sp. 5P4]|uniref:hypothetical protein n=1 Tax=Rhodosalinus sp. 5P4 TaxID=3239196 RepID=UPI003524B55E